MTGRQGRKDTNGNVPHVLFKGRQGGIQHANMSRKERINTYLLNALKLQLRDGDGGNAPQPNMNLKP